MAVAVLKDTQRQQEGSGVLRFVTVVLKMGGVCPVHNRCENSFNVVNSSLRGVSISACALLYL